MLALSLGESENRLAGLAFTVDVSFTVTEFVFTKLKESAEFIIFTAARVDVT